MTTPAVSVVMPVYNAAPTVAAAVASIRAQTLENWELIAVDDGSTDASAAILADLAAADPRIRVLPQAHAGVVAAGNAALAAARAPLVARLDADDEAYPERLARQAAFLAANPDLGVVGCLVDFGGDPVAQAGYARHVAWTNTLVTDARIRLARFVESPLPNPSTMFRVDLPARLGAWRHGDFPEDYELWLRWLDAGVRMAKVPVPLLRWNDPPNRLSRTDSRYASDAFFRCKAEYLARWLRRHDPRWPTVWVWGAGRVTRRHAACLADHGVVIAGYVDIDPDKAGHVVNGVPVILHDDLPTTPDRFIVNCVTSRGARELIGGHLAARGWREGRDYIHAG